MVRTRGSPSWDWRNVLTRAPDDPWWDRQGYLTEHDSVGVATLHGSSWLDRWLRGNVHARDALPRVQYYTIGRDRWRTGDAWPVPGTRETAFYLRSDGGAKRPSKCEPCTAVYVGWW